MNISKIPHKKIISITAFAVGAIMYVTPAFSATTSLTNAGTSGYVYEDYTNDFGTRAGISGNVVMTIDQRSFLMRSELDNSLMLVVVVGKEEFSNAQLQNIEDKDVHVEGRVQNFSIDQLEKRVHVSLDKGDLKKYEGTPVMVVDTIDLK